MLLIRADGNPWIGTGHIMRCLSLADALRECGADVVFVTAEPYFQGLIQARGYLCEVLGTAYDRMDEELPVLIPLLARKRPELVILDSYFVTPKYMKAIKVRARLLYIDDMNTFDYPADIVVNYTIYGPELLYPQNKTYFLGPQYALLRKEFQGLKKRIVKERAEDILVSTGGTDQYHVALHCADYLKKHPPCENTIFHLVLGAMNLDVEALRLIAVELPFIQLYCQVKDMCSLMQQCDVAISAGGTTLFELCASGTPTVTYILADNQIMNATSFEKAGLMLNAGDIRGGQPFAGNLFQSLDKLVNDCALRQSTSEQMQMIIDGQGAWRLAREICSLI